MWDAGIGRRWESTGREPGDVGGELEVEEEEIPLYESYAESCQSCDFHVYP